MSILHFASSQKTVVKYYIVGVGGAGGHIVNRLIESGIEKDRCIVIDTNATIDKNSSASTIIRIGSAITSGTGAGGNPDVGARSAAKDVETIAQHLAGADIVFVVAGMGGGTGTGASPIVVDIARRSGALTIGVVSKPFGFEGKKRMRIAELGIEELKKYVDSLMIISNDKLLSVSDETTSFLDAFRMSDSVLKDGIEAIASIISEVGDINIDFADIRTVMCGRGTAHMGQGDAEGEDRVKTALKKAIESPLLETSIKGAQAVLLNVTGGEDLGMLEVNEAASIVCDEVDPSAIIIFGTSIKKDMKNKAHVTIVATGLGE